MKISHVLKAATVVICCFIVFAFVTVIIPIGIGLLAIWVIAIMLSEDENLS